MTETNKCPKVEPRKLLDVHYPDGYMQSDKDFILRNIEAAVWLLENELSKPASKPESGITLTSGYRARIKPTSSWAKNWNYGNHEVILTERSSNNDFSVMVLKEGVKVPLDHHWETVCDEVAWIHESNLDLVDKDIDTNIRFINWWHEHEEDFCPDCGYFDENVLAKYDYYPYCPKCNCEWGI